MSVDHTHIQMANPAQRWRPSAAGAFRAFVRLLPAMALFALVLTDDPLLQWLSMLGLAPLALALMPGAPGGCVACRADVEGRGILPPAH